MDVLDDVSNTYVIDFVDSRIVTLEIVTKKNAIVTAYNSKYFKGCLTLFTLLHKHSDNYIDVIYVLILG